MAKRRTAPERSRRVKRTARRPRRRRISWFRTAVFVGVLGLAGYAVWAVHGYLGTTLEIKYVEVSGNQSLTEAHVLEVSGVAEGASLLWTSLRRAKARLESDLRIRSARLQREFPDKVRIEIAEREPFAILQSPTGWHLVDAEGVIFLSIASPKEHSGAGLPTILLNSNSKEGEWATQAVACLQKAGGLWREEVVGVEVSSTGSLALRLDSGLLVRLGAGPYSDLAGKIDLAAEILRRDSELCSRGEYLDVSCPGAPACRLKGESDPGPSPGG